MVGLDGQGPRRNMIGKLGTKKFGERGIWIGLSEWAKSVKIFVSYVNSHQRMNSAKGNFNNQVDGLTFSVDTSQPLSPATLVITQRTHKQSGHGGKDGGLCMGLEIWTCIH